MFPPDTDQLLGVIIARLHNFIRETGYTRFFRGNSHMLLGYAKANNKGVVIGKHGLFPRDFGN
ncbi:hypothetical protein D3C73_1459150 [compost metagenome]